MFKIQQACELASQFDSRLQTFMDWKFTWM